MTLFRLFYISGFPCQEDIGRLDSLNLSSTTRQGMFCGKRDHIQLYESFHSIKDLPNILNRVNPYIGPLRHMTLALSH